MNNEPTLFDVTTAKKLLAAAEQDFNTVIFDPKATDTRVKLAARELERCQTRLRLVGGLD